MTLLALFLASVVLVQVEASSLFQSIPFDPFRLECPKKHGVTEVTLKMVESAGFQRQDVLFTMKCDPIDDMFPPANPELDDMEREDCYWSELFDPIIASDVNHTCSENEYLAGVSRIAFTSVQLLCCRLRTRQQYKCVQERYPKPIGPDPQQQFQSHGSMVSSIAIKDDFYLVRYCEMTQKSIDQIKEDLPTKPTTPTTTTTTTTATTTPSTVPTTTSSPTPSRRTRSTTPAPPTTTPLPTTPAPTRPPKRVILVTRPRPVFHFAPGAELSTVFPQQPDPESFGVAPPSAGPPATFDGGEEQQLPRTGPPSPPAPPQAQSQEAEEYADEIDQQSSFGESNESVQASEEDLSISSFGQEARLTTEPNQQGVQNAEQQTEEVAPGRSIEDIRRQLAALKKSLQQKAPQSIQSTAVSPSFQATSSQPSQPAPSPVGTSRRPPSSIVSGISEEFSPFEEEAVETATIRIWPSAVKSGGRPNTVAPRTNVDVPRRAQERKDTKVTPFATAGASTVAQTGTSLPPGWIPFDGIPGVSPEVMRNINFPYFEEDRHAPPDANYIEMSHLTDYPELEVVDNGEQSLSPLIPITTQPLIAKITAPAVTTPLPQQRPVQVQERPRAQGEPVAKPKENLPKKLTLDLVISTTTSRSVVEGAEATNNDDEKMIVFENQYKEKTRKPWPTNRRPLPDLEGRSAVQAAPAPVPLQPIIPLFGEIEPLAPSAGVAPPSAGPPSASVASTQVSSPRQTVDSEKFGSEEAESPEVLTFCTKEIAVKDANRMIIACGIDDDVWQPSHCPVGSECFQVTDSTYRICCFSAGRK